MPGLDPGIHLEKSSTKKMDCRVKPGNDGGWGSVQAASIKLRRRSGS